MIYMIYIYEYTGIIILLTLLGYNICQFIYLILYHFLRIYEYILYIYISKLKIPLPSNGMYPNTFLFSLIYHYDISNNHSVMSIYNYTKIYDGFLR